MLKNKNVAEIILTNNRKINFFFLYMVSKFLMQDALWDSRMLIYFNFITILPFVRIKFCIRLAFAKSIESNNLGF